MKDQELISYDELRLAYERWRSVHVITHSQYLNAPNPWMTFLDVHPPQDSLRRKDDAMTQYWVPLKGARRVHLLNGPHWQTLLKVWAIQGDPVKAFAAKYRQACQEK